MPRRFIFPLLLVCALASSSCRRHSGLAVTFNENGIERLSYDDVVLEDSATNPADAFHIGHMKCSDVHGIAVTSGQFGWGENNNGRHWDRQNMLWKYEFSWGSIAVQYLPYPDRLDIKVTEVVRPDSNVTFDGATVYPLALHFPTLPAGFKDSSFLQLAFNTKGPSVIVADYGQGEVVSTVPDSSRPLFSGFAPATGTGSSWSAVISSTSMDNMPSAYPRFDRPVRPGGTDSFLLSLRFSPSGIPPSKIAGDVYAMWDRARPVQLNWPDRRIIGTAYLATAPQSDSSERYANNPRRFFNDNNAKHFDVRNPEGLENFQKRVLQQAHEIALNLRRLNAQGVITWDIEGEQFPHKVSYACAPDQVEELAPEMESVIADGSSSFEGMKLDDAYFKVIRNAGFRIGVCVRPQHLAVAPDGTAEQIYLPASQLEDELMRKIRFARKRWGATLFYLDSTRDQAGRELDSRIFADLAEAFPDSLFIPEHFSPVDYACTAGFRSFLLHSEYGTSGAIYNFYPNAFSAILVNDVDPERLNAYRQQLTQSVHRGDLLMLHADYWQANNDTALQIYKEANVAASAVVKSAS